MSKRKKRKPRMRCVIQSRHGGKDSEESRGVCSLSTHATHIYTCQTGSRLWRTMLQHLPKKSENGLKLKFSSHLPCCLTLVVQTPSAATAMHSTLFLCLMFSSVAMCRCHQNVNKEQETENYFLSASISFLMQNSKQRITAA